LDHAAFAARLGRSLLSRCSCSCDWGCLRDIRLRAAEALLPLLLALERKPNTVGAQRLLEAAPPHQPLLSVA
jgi:hypothetical protein